MIQSELLAEFRQTRTYCALLMCSMLPATAALLSLIAYNFSLAVVVLCGMLCLLAIALAGWNAYKVRVLLYPDKIVKHSLLRTKLIKLNARTEFYYYHLQPLIRGVLVRQPYISLKYGKKSLTFDNSIRYVDVLRDALLELEQIYQKPVTEHALLNRRSIFFGELKVSATGLAYKNQVLSYQDVKDCSLQKGHFKVLKQQGQQTAMDIPVSKIPNIKTFFAVLDYYMAR